MISQAILVAIIMLLLSTKTNSAPMPLVGCPTSCGNVSIPFPFGISSNCSLDDSFLITCDHNYNPPKPFLNSGTIEVLEISLDGLMKIASPVASDCYDDSGSQVNTTISELTLSKFAVSSTRNKFTAVGCDTYALIEGSKSEWKQMSAGCVSWCDGIDSVVNKTCSGIGCCQTSIPNGVKDFMVDIRSFRNHTTVKSFNPCGYAFVVENESFEFSSTDLKDLGNRKSVPVVLDWSVGNVTCEEGWRNLSTFACRAAHGVCHQKNNEAGYYCKCRAGFQGNPYRVDGCQDIDECDALKPCEGTCTNLEGSYSCSCPKGFEGDGKKDGVGCHRKTHINGSTLLYIVSGFMVPAVGSSWIFWRRKQKKVVKLRQSLFIKNGGKILEHKQCTQKTLSVFTAEDLKLATNNYDVANFRHRERHFGITYEGRIPDGTNRKVIVEMCNELDDDDITVFISKIVDISRISHRNVVKLLGCCLETQVPVLVYEIFTFETLYDHIHDDVLARALSWEIRLKIAAEIAGALAYMHSFSTVPIIHGNLNSFSVLLHHDYTVKLRDFALTLSYAGMMGYSDPEYSFSTARLTTKSDVYSFGVVLTELLTGKNVMSSDWPGGDNLVRMLDDRLAIDGKIAQLTEVAKLAERCLLGSSMDRPTMKEVVITLENAISKNSNSTTICPNTSQGTTAARRVARRNRSF